VSFRAESRLAAGQIEYTVRRTASRGVCAVRLSLRIPESHVPRRVLVDGKAQDFAKGFVEFPLGDKEVRIVVDCDSREKL